MTDQTLYRAWYEFHGVEVPARGRHNSICMTADELLDAKLCAKRNGHPITRQLTLTSPGDQIVHTARGHLGQHEIGGSNRGPQVNAWLERSHCEPGQPWCMAFASCMVADAGYPLPFGETAGCGTAIEQAREHGIWVPNDGHTIPRRGWIAIVAPAEHAMIVEEATRQAEDDIAGNTSESDGTNYDGGYVAEHNHQLSIIAGWIRTY